MLGEVKRLILLHAPRSLGDKGGVHALLGEVLLLLLLLGFFLFFFSLFFALLFFFIALLRRLLSLLRPVLVSPRGLFDGPPRLVGAVGLGVLLWLLLLDGPDWLLEGEGVVVLLAGALRRLGSGLVEQLLHLRLELLLLLRLL